jgi:hypothetical protein
MSGESIDLFKSTIGDPDMMASEISGMWESWKGAKQIREAIIAEVHQYLAATSTDETENEANGHNHTTHRPKLTQIYDNLMANYMSGLIPNESFFRFDAEDEQSLSIETKNNVEAYLRTKHRQVPGKFKGRIKDLVADWLDGDCFAQVSYSSQSHVDPKTQEQLSGYQGPVVNRISPTNIVFNPLASSFRSTPKIIRSVKTLGELARDIEENPELGYQKETFDKIITNRSASRGVKEKDLNEAVQLTYDGFGSYAQYIRGNEVEILEFYGDIFNVDTGELLKNYCVTVFDRMYIARQQPTDTYDGHPAIFHASYRRRHNNIWGMGAIENLVGMQYYINHLENAKADAFDDMLMPDRVIAGFVDEEIGEDGQITYHVDGNGSVSNLAPDATVLNADFKINEMEAKMDRYAGAPSEGVGIRSPGEKTKFEVSTLENNRGRFFQYNMEEFETAILEDIINAEVYMARKYLAENKDTIRFDDDATGAKVFKEITRSDIMGNGKLLPTGARHFARQAQLSQNLLQFQSNILAADPSMAQHFPTEKLARLWEELLEFERYGLVVPYGRIPEQLQAQRLMQAADRSLQDEEAVDLEDEGDPGDSFTEVPE